MFNFINKLFIKNYKDYNNKIVRKNYGYVTSIIGIIINFILFFIKLFLGVFSNSVSIIVDSFNSLSDSISSLISILAIKISNKPADKEHPFGHGRAEYLASLIVAFFIALLAFEFLKTSFHKIFSPEILVVNSVIIIIMFVNIALKLWVGLYYKHNGEKISSKVLLASSKDALNDCIITFVTLVVLFVYSTFQINIDGIAGIFLSIILFKTAYDIAKDTISVLLGEGPDSKLTIPLKEDILKYDGVLGIHDLIIHSYGESYTLATVHVEVSDKENILKSHELIDRIEKEVGEKLNIHLTIHMDPIDYDDPILKEITKNINNYIEINNLPIYTHDFRIVHGDDSTNLIFECHIPFDYGKEHKDSVKKEIIEIVKSIDKSYVCVINFEYGIES